VITHLLALAESWQLKAANMAAWARATGQADLTARAAERAQCAQELRMQARVQAEAREPEAS
jgi:hypothetical protein